MGPVQDSAESVAYNVSTEVAISGNTDLDALRRAFHRLAARHPMLRTVFAGPAGEPCNGCVPGWMWASAWRMPQIGVQPNTTSLDSTGTEGLDLVGLEEPLDQILEEPEQDHAMGGGQRQVAR